MSQWTHYAEHGFRDYDGYSLAVRNLYKNTEKIKKN